MDIFSINNHFNILYNGTFILILFGFISLVYVLENKRLPLVNVMNNKGKVLFFEAINKSNEDRDKEENDKLYSGNDALSGNYLSSIFWIILIIIVAISIIEAFFSK